MSTSATYSALFEFAFLFDGAYFFLDPLGTSPRQIEGSITSPGTTGTPLTIEYPGDACTDAGSGGTGVRVPLCGSVGTTSP